MPMTDSQKNYAKKTKMLGIKYYPTDMSEYDRLIGYLSDNNLTVNGYVKQLIKNDLDSKGIDY